MKIFRIQNSQGEGPFRASARPQGGTYRIEKFYTTDWHPMPSKDFLVLASQVPFTMQYGCDSIVALKKWFVLTPELLAKAETREAFDNPESSIEGENRAIMDDFMNSGFYLAEIDISDDFCEYGNSLHQVRYDSCEIIGTITHSLKTLYQGHL